MFLFENVMAVAHALAEKPYENPDAQIPAFLKSLTKGQWEGLRFRPESALWKNDSLPFEVQFYHPGFIYNRLVTVNVVDDGQPKAIPFSEGMFEHGDEALAAQLRQTPLNFAGFSLYYCFGGPDGQRIKDKLAVFLGATYFQAVGRHSHFGVSARALAVNTALPDGEEFPYFREFWIVKPKPGDASLTIYALMDSPSLTGAYRLEIIPGTSTVMNVESTLFKRLNAKEPEKIGLAPLTSMFLYSETDNGKPGDYRPEVHDSDGLLFSTGPNAWTWSPLVNPVRLMINDFPLTNPRGFGLMQRDDCFDHYQDIAARYDRRSSLWVEPVGDWGAGNLELIELPGTADYNGNITAFWLPAKPDKPETAAATGAAEQATEARPFLSLAYKLYWMTPGASPHELGKVTATRTVKPQQNDTVTFIIDFAGEDLNAIPDDTGLTSVVETPEQAPLLDKQLVKNPVTGGWRLTLKFRLPQSGVVQSILSARDGPPHLRFSAFLKKGENLSDPLTETWVYELVT